MSHPIGMRSTKTSGLHTPRSGWRTGRLPASISCSLLSSPPNSFCMATSTIRIEVELDEQKVPSNIQWSATDSTVEKPQEAKAFMLSLWDGADKAALRIDLWTQKMMVDEMADFYYQTLMTMADTFQRATRMTDLTDEMKAYAQAFYKKFQDEQMKQNKAG